MIPLEIITKILFIAKDLLRTSVTISIENNCSYSLINPTILYLDCGDNVSPASPIIPPKRKNDLAAKFEGIIGTTGMLCYHIEGSYEPKKDHDPYYLLISWKVKRFTQNQLCINLYESKESPLSREPNQRNNFYKLMHEKYKLSSDQSFLLEGKKFRVGATISSNDSAEIKIYLEDYKSSKPKTKKRLFRKIQKIRLFLTKPFRKKKKKN